MIYETVLGWAGKELDLKFATPIFDGASLDQINEYTAKAGIRAADVLTCTTAVRAGGSTSRLRWGVIYMLKARPHDRRQDARPFDRSLFAYHATAARQ